LTNNPEFGNLNLKTLIMKNYHSNYQFNTNINRLYSSNRKIPVGVQLKIWFGNVLTIIGLAFFIMGLPFSFAFISFSDFFGPSFNHDDPTTVAMITESIPTNSYINDVQVFEYKYEYKTSDGKTFSGTGYTTGNMFEIGNEIKVQYQQDNYAVSKTNDLRSSEFGGGFTLIVLIFPLTGMIMLFFSTRKAIKEVYILKIGELAEGRLLSKIPTNTKINNQTVFELQFEFKASDGQIYQAKCRTHQYYRLEDEQLEKLVYDPDMPSNAVMLDALPKGIKEFFLRNF
jgi:hypothetical protein